MIQEEIKNFLTEKKIFVKDKSKEIQLKLFELGFKWYDYPTQEPKHLNKPFLFMDKLQKLSYGLHPDFFYKHSYEEISAEDILNIKVEHLPKTWEEFCENSPVKEGEAHILFDSSIHTIQLAHPRHHTSDKSVLTSYEAAKAHLALIQLHQLRDYYREGSKFPYAISRNGSHLYISNNEDKFLSFQTKEIADEFLNNFKDLIEQAGDLI